MRSRAYYPAVQQQYYCQLDIISYALNIWCANECHRYSLATAKPIIREKTAKLSAIGITLYADIHHTEAWYATINLLSQQNQTGAGSEYRKSVLNPLT